MTRCSNCGGGDFELLLSGKYRCKYCGTEQLPSAIQTHVVEAATPFFDANIFRKHAVGFSMIAVAIVALAYFGFVYAAAQATVGELAAAYEEITVQQQRSIDILSRNKTVLLQQYDIDVQKEPFDKIIAALSAANDARAQRILDDLAGSFNREVIAERRYRKALGEFQSQANWLSRRMGKKYIRDQQKRSATLIQQK